MSFQNIFSKTKKGNLKKAKIIIDHREKNSLVPAILIKLGAEIEFKHLEVGDYITKDVIIERKTISDLKSSIINKRIIKQIHQLKQQKAQILLLIEGISEYDLYEGLMHENALRGFILSTALNYQIPIIFSQDYEDTAKYLHVLAKKPENKSPISLLEKRIPKSLKEQKQFIIEGFPGIGPVKARKLLKKFKTIKNIINAPKEELEKVLGKNSKTFKKIIN